MSVKITWVHWLFLCCSILFEVCGTSVMKISHSWEFAFAAQLGLAVMWGCIACSYYCLSRATMALPIGVAFALWDALGLVIIVAVSVLVIGEQLDLIKAIGLLCVLFGGFLVHHGTDTSETAAKAE